MGLSDVLDKAARPRQDVQLCFAGGLVAEYKRVRAEADADDSLASPHMKRVDELQEEIEERSVTLTVEGVSPAEWQRLLEEHPPHTKAQEDIGFDPPAFYRAAIQRCLMDVSDDEFDRLMDKINDAQFDQLAHAVQAVNRVAPNLDFMSRGSGKT